MGYLLTALLLTLDLEYLPLASCHSSTAQPPLASSATEQHPIVDVTGDGSKVQCCKEQYCTGIWKVRSMNQGKLEVVKEETRVNIDILGISELRWTGMGEFNSDDHYINYCGQESLRRNRVATMVNRRV